MSRPRPLTSQRWATSTTETLRKAGLVAKTRPVQAYKNAAIAAKREKAKLSKREFKPIPNRPRGE
ncbi:uncharacterized protein PpBr36_10849 [Pyricularia pennisetigena]|uniref:uncharacterized protein n=1 Tax=Pyricularia pennisetigena TaxID=1578925 RepID=UPI00114E1872|nr:uncharacterized protein PpBr36_10849 [Pyricularia pennisetigena]TLS20869.1 hypothetical protein PpBr36_10849 [Pyricularia pennisetigena]